MASSAKIMVVDDSDLALHIARTALEEAGFEVVTRSNPIGTAAAILRERPRLVLLDVSMPMLGGQEVAQSIKANAGLKHTSILLHSNLHPRELSQLASMTGADGYVKKGDPRSLVEAVRSYLSMPTSDQPPGYTLFVSSDPTVLSELRQGFSGSGEATYARNGREAIERISSAPPPAVVVCDLDLEDGTSESLYRMALAQDPTYENRFVFITGSTEQRGFVSDLPVPVFHRPLPISKLRHTIDYMRRWNA